MCVCFFFGKRSQTIIAISLNMQKPQRLQQQQQQVDETLV